MLRNVLTFIKVSKIPQAEFEAKLDLPPGSLQRFLVEKRELTPEIMAKINNVYRKEIQEQGYYTLDLSLFGGVGIGMIYGGRDEHNPFEEGTDAYTNWLIDHRRKQRVGETQNWVRIEVLGIVLPPTIQTLNYHEILDMLNDTDYLSDISPSTDILIFRTRKNYREGVKTSIYIDPTDGYNESVFWTLGRLTD